MLRLLSRQTLAAGVATHNCRSFASRHGPYGKVLVANRGENACRIIRTCREMGLKSVAVYSDIEENALHVKCADEAICVGSAPIEQSYLNIDSIVEAAKQTGATAIHPGYGLLAEDIHFAKRLHDEQLLFIGPPTSAIELMRNKLQATEIAKKAGMKIIPGTIAEPADDQELLSVGSKLGYPIVLKAALGHGGRGIRVARDATEAMRFFQMTKDDALLSFADSTVYVNTYFEDCRQLSFHYIGDHHGNYQFLGETESSVQRNFQKIVDEAPCSLITPKMRTDISNQAVKLLKAVNYYSVGSVEILIDRERNIYFLGMNARLPTELDVVEAVAGVDIVEQSIRVAFGESVQNSTKSTGSNNKKYAMMCRVTAEDPYNNFCPSTGVINTFEEPLLSDEVHVELGVTEGDEITTNYDSLITKVVTVSDDRFSAADKMLVALDYFVVSGVKTNLPLLRNVIQNPRFLSGDLNTNFISDEYKSGFSGHRLSDRERKEIACTAFLVYLTNKRRAIRAGKKKKKVKLSSNSNERKEEDEEALTNEFIRVIVEKVQYSFYGALLQNGKGKVFMRNMDNDEYEDKEAIRRKIEAKEINLMDSKNISELNVEFDWRAGDRILETVIDESNSVAQLKAVLPGKVILQYCGSEFEARVETPLQQELRQYVPGGKDVSNPEEILTAPIPGVVTHVCVQVGDRVSLDQQLVIIQSMTTKHIIRATHEGTVSDILVKEGEPVLVNADLIYFE